MLAAVRINGQASRLASWLRDVANFRKAAELGISHRLSAQPQIGDFADLSLDADELAALRECRPGKCDLLLGDKAIASFQADVDWTSPDAGRRANLTLRQLLLSYADAYLKGGDQALGAVHDEKNPRVRVDEFHQVLWQSKELYDIAPPLTAYLEQFPNARPPAADQFLYWGKGGVGPDASITLHQIVIYPAPGGETLRRRQAALLEPLYRCRAGRDLARLVAGRPGLLRDRRREGALADAQWNGGAPPPRQSGEGDRRDRDDVSGLGAGQHDDLTYPKALPRRTRTQNRGTNPGWIRDLSCSSPWLRGDVFVISRACGSAIGQTSRPRRCPTRTDSSAQAPA